MQIQSKVAVCLITGNEEAIIGRALDSAFTVSDTVIVVRACGGQKPDSSLEIARQRGCIVGEYHNSPATVSWPFVDDFAAARNEAFRLAAEAGAEWLMWLDCDDTLPPGMGETIKQACAETKEDWILAEYVLPNHSKTVMRERLFRTGTAAWFHGVHEKCVPVTPDKDKESLQVRVRKDIKVIHQPLDAKSGSQERNLNILLWRYQETQHIAFYLHYEFYLLGRKEEAVKYGLQALRLDNLDGVYRYEVMLNLALLAAENEHAQDLCQRAIKLCPQRREAHNILALLQMDAGQAEDAIKTAEHTLTLAAPKIPEWTHRPDCYGWKAYATLAWANRLAENEAKAKEIEAALLEEGGKPRISLLHATRGRWSQAIAAMNMWLARAENPAAVEHWFAIDEDDTESREKLSRFRHVIASQGGYSVGAWNTAAQAATGDVLIQIADDFEPPPGWDRLILDALGGDLFAPKVLRVSDGSRTDGLLTLAIVTRRWFEQHGLFDESFINVYSDTDLTARAEKAGAIKDARHIVVKHHHPFFNSKVPMDATYERGNNPAEYERAKALFHAKHS
jgi:glycosyltransferase involved in cell wall biosynthesis